MKPKNQRLALIAAAVAAVLIAVLLAMWGLRERASYFYTPAEVAAGKASRGQSIRLGGMVERGSVQRQPGGGPCGGSVTAGCGPAAAGWRDDAVCRYGWPGADARRLSWDRA